jgi:hypothetical protein
MSGVVVLLVRVGAVIWRMSAGGAKDAELRWVRGVVGVGRADQRHSTNSRPNAPPTASRTSSHCSDDSIT